MPAWWLSPFSFCQQSNKTGPKIQIQKESKIPWISHAQSIVNSFLPADVYLIHQNWILSEYGWVIARNVAIIWHVGTHNLAHIFAEFSISFNESNFI